MQITKKSWLWGLDNWSLGNSGFDDLYNPEVLLIAANFIAPACSLHFYPKAFPEEDEQKGALSFSSEVFWALSFPIPSKYEQPSCQYDCPGRGIWLTCSSLHNGPESSQPRACPCPWHCDTWAQIPNVMSHLLVASKHSWEQETQNRWLKCLQKDSPRQPGRCRALLVMMGHNICSAKNAEGKSDFCTHRAHRTLAQMLGISCLGQSVICIFKIPIKSLISSLGSLDFQWS